MYGLYLKPFASLFAETINNPQLERLLDELDRVFQHALPGALGPNVDVAVVGIPPLKVV